MLFGSPAVVRRVIGFVVFSLDVNGLVKGALVVIDFVGLTFIVVFFVDIIGFVQGAFVVIDFVVLTLGHFAKHSLRLALAVLWHLDRD